MGRLKKVHNIITECKSQNLTFSKRDITNSDEHIHAQMTKDHFKEVKEIILGKQ